MRLDGLDMALARDAQGRINVMQLAAPEAAKTSAGAPAGGQAPAKDPWQIAVQSFELRGARLRLDDALAPRVAALSVDGIDATIGPITWPVTQPAALSLQGQLHEAGKDAAVATLEVQGSATQTQANASLRVQRGGPGGNAWTLHRAVLQAAHRRPRGARRESIERRSHPHSASTWPVQASTRCASSMPNEPPRGNEKKKPRDAVAWKRLDGGRPHGSTCLRAN